MGPTRVWYLLWVGATEEEPLASPAAGAVMERTAGALGPALEDGPAAEEGPAAATSAAGDPAAAEKGQAVGGDGPGAPMAEKCGLLSSLPSPNPEKEQLEMKS